VPLLRLLRVLTKGIFVTFEGSRAPARRRRSAVSRPTSPRRASSPRHPRARRHPLADEIRRLVLVPREEPVFPEAELLLYEAARAQHVRGLILPALRSGRAVLCEPVLRCDDGVPGARAGLDAGQVEHLNRFAAGGLVPRLTLLFDLPPEEGFARIKGRGFAPDRLERESLDFHRAWREGYLRLAGRSPDRIVRIDADAPEEEVSRSVLQAVAQRFGW